MTWNLSLYYWQNYQMGPSISSTPSKPKCLYSGQYHGPRAWTLQSRICRLFTFHTACNESQWMDVVINCVYVLTTWCHFIPALRRSIYIYKFSPSSQEIFRQDCYVVYSPGSVLFIRLFPLTVINQFCTQICSSTHNNKLEGTRRVRTSIKA